MRRIKYLALVLLVVFSTFLCSCKEETKKEITCDMIVTAYEEAGYWVWHSDHYEGEDEYCHIRAQKTEDAEDYIYFCLFQTEEGAQKQKEQDEHNIARWLIFIMFGEARWCQSKRYGKIQYSYYDTSLVEPFNNLID